MKKIHKKMIYTMAAMLVAVFILSLFSGSGVRIARAAAKATSEYTLVMDDLTKDTEFNAADYPEIEDDFSLQVIQIAESTDGELFVYVYQPSADEKFNATTLRLSLTTGEKAEWNDYKLTLLSSEGALSKYLVNGVSVSDEAIRYYDIAAIHRKWIDGTDAITSNATSNGNHINEVVFAVGQLWAVKIENGQAVYAMQTTETVEIKPEQKYVGQLRYKEGVSGIFVGISEYSDIHYVAFDCDHRIDKLFAADVGFVKQNYERIEEGYFEDNRTVLIEKGIGSPVGDKVTLTQTGEHETNSSGWLPSKKYTWKEIQSVRDFSSNLNIEAKKAIQDKQWVLCFCATEYTERTFTGIPYRYTINYVKISEVTVLRLNFETDGVTYNLGVVDNKQEGSHKPDNVSEANDWWLYALVLIGGSIVVLIFGKMISKRIGVRAMAILGSFLCLIIAGTLRITAEVYMERFGWLSKLIMPLDITCYVMIAIFALFVLVEIFSALGSRRKSRRRYDADDGGEWE